MDQTSLLLQPQQQNEFNDKYIIHFLWVTSDQLVSSGEILNAIKCLETLIIFNEQNENEHEIDYQILHKQFKKKEDKIKKKKKKLLEQQPNLIPFKMTPTEEAITRIKIAELLFNYTHNYNDSRFYLEKASLLLSVDQQSSTSLDLQTKISSFLIDIFLYGNQINLIKQEIKKGLKYSKL
ncbi:hypothetical protein DICPUDRAFT_160510 [Dictyostelium purpureum]|uniref:Uncharacterized protein n=1 Tax=Dictyostelium purpureum TaxID=5786 RepID=F1A6F2_DICPU|nr:uncharacterized protein DICPUDRAFT_160510 [Dictyostelium purpureum]EGC28228.1 hypothetical protein DICPUDRAFT_160510 [Dictyostelium purpureum]|eukprot:XP_003295247.1 hypothetical protein DICPUDRAFT_160510 [Dictyostelium purpureum]